MNCLSVFDHFLVLALKGLSIAHVDVYTPLVWMFPVKTSVKKICKTHHRTLQIIHNDYQNSYDELLDINKDVNIHQKHLRILALEVFKSITHVNPEFMWSYFNENTIPYNLRNGNRLLLPHTKSVKFGINSMIFRGSLLRNNLPLTLKSCKPMMNLNSN